MSETYQNIVFLLSEARKLTERDRKLLTSSQRFKIAALCRITEAFAAASPTAEEKMDWRTINGCQWDREATDIGGMG